MTANIVVEQNKDGYFSCFVEEEIPYVGLLGYGESSVEAIDSLIAFYEESKRELAAEGKVLPDLDFVVHYDMPSFFDSPPGGGGVQCSNHIQQRTFTGAGFSNDGYKFPFGNGEADIL